MVLKIFCLFWRFRIYLANNCLFADAKNLQFRRYFFVVWRRFSIDSGISILSAFAFDYLGKADVVNFLLTVQAQAC